MIKYFLLLLLALASCNKKKTNGNFDSATWQNDKLGCKGERQQALAGFNSIRNDLKGLSQSEIIGMLGKPDLQVLYTRNQKFYIYFIEKGIQCEGNEEESKARAVSIRFSALDSVTEVMYSDGKPI